MCLDGNSQKTNRFFFLAADEESGVSLLKEQLHNVTVSFFFFYFPLDQGSLCLAGGGR